MNCNFCSYWLAGKSYWLLKFVEHLVPRVEHVLAKPNLPLFDCFLWKQVYYFTLIRTNCNSWFRTINPRELIKPDLLAFMYTVQEISSSKVHKLLFFLWYYDRTLKSLKFIVSEKFGLVAGLLL